MIFALISLAAAVSSIFIGFFIYYKNPENLLNKVILCCSVAMAFCNFTEFGYRQAATYDVAYFWLKLSSFWAIALALLLHFALVYTDHLNLLKKKLSYLLLYIPAFMFFLLDLTTNLITEGPIKEYWGWTYTSPANSLINYLYNIWILAIILITFYLFLQFYLKVTYFKKKQQAKYILLGFSVVWVLSFVTDISLPIYDITFPELTSFAIIINYLIWGYAMWKYEMFVLNPKTVANDILANISDCVLLVEPDGGIRSINQTTLKLLGYKEHEIINQPIKIIFSTDVDEKNIAKTPVFEDLTSIEKIYDVERMIVAKDGRYIPLSLSLYPIRDKNGELQGIIFVGRDMTERKKMEELKFLEDIKKQNKELKNLIRLRDEFFENITHEFRTPLTALKGFTELLLKSKNIGFNELEDLKIIYRNEIKLENLISELVDYVRLRTNILQLKKDKFRVSKIINNLKKDFKLQLLKKQLSIRDYYEPDVELFLNEILITRLILNLLHNAIKFSNSNSKIKLKSKIEEKRWIFSITDFGIGIKKEDVPLIFSRFQKLKDSRKSNVEGMGLGLVICKNIVSDYCGRIWVESTGLGKGATFHFEIPLNQ